MANDTYVVSAARAAALMKHATAEAILRPMESNLLVDANTVENSTSVICSLPATEPDEEDRRRLGDVVDFNRWRSATTTRTIPKIFPVHLFWRHVVVKSFLNVSNSLSAISF